MPTSAPNSPTPPRPATWPACRRCSITTATFRQHAGRAGLHPAPLRRLLRAPPRRPAICSASARTLTSISLDPLRNQPLHAAASSGHAEIVRLLLEAGADPRRRAERAVDRRCTAAAEKGACGRWSQLAAGARARRCGAAERVRVPRPLVTRAGARDTAAVRSGAASCGPHSPSDGSLETDHEDRHHLLSDLRRLRRARDRAGARAGPARATRSTSSPTPRRSGCAASPSGSTSTKWTPPSRATRCSTTTPTPWRWPRSSTRWRCREELDILHVHYAIPHATTAWLAREMLQAPSGRSR